MTHFKQASRVSRVVEGVRRAPRRQTLDTRRQTHVVTEETSVEGSRVRRGCIEGTSRVDVEGVEARAQVLRRAKEVLTGRKRC